MMNRYTYILMVMLLLLTANISMAQNEPEKAGRMENGQFILQVNLNWDSLQMSRLAELFDLDSLLLDAIIREDFGYINDSTAWVATVNNNLLKLSKEISTSTDTDTDNIILSAFYDRPAQPGTLQAAYGINKFSSPVFRYDNGVACFRLSERANARSVFLSGSFNQWSTMQMPMQKTDSGWVACIALPPGKYHYKYIVDGRWIHDPANQLRERDGHRGHNSVVYAMNYRFHLPGYPNARKVVVAGSFNQFRPNELLMNKTPLGWELPLYLAEGTHAYKFIVDGTWITDPLNPVTRPDGRGNINSFLGIGEPYLFSTDAFADAARVMLAGTFNVWNTAELAMERVNGKWQLSYVLAPGNYEYKFVVDGQWKTDPSNPFTVGQGDYTNSFLACKPTHTFTLDAFKDATKVIVTGSFNSWNPNEYRMHLQNGQWVFPLHLPPGRYSYRIIVDGQWMEDPGNPLWETNEFGGRNSILWIE